MPPVIDIFSLTSAEFIDAAASIGVRRQDALIVYRRAFRHGIVEADWCAIDAAPIVNTLHEHGTIKFVQRCADGLEAESVILPCSGSTGRARNTLCVSSQVGCAMGCTFCETGQMGLMRNLTAAQIVGQWFAARFLPLPPGEGRGERLQGFTRSKSIERLPRERPSPQPSPKGRGSQIDNIVFMGMGEPMDNLDQVIRAIRVLTDRNGAGIAPARISVSTVGRTEGISQLAELARTPGFGKLRLAVSINAPNDEIRSQIMPINRAAPMAKLMNAMLQWPTDGRQRVLIEYVLIPGVNDALGHADQLCDYLRPLSCTVNVIPYNPRRQSPWPAPSEESVRQFVQRIHDRGQFVKRRQTLGRSVMAACGQLGNPMIRRRSAARA